MSNRVLIIQRVLLSSVFIENEVSIHCTVIIPTPTVLRYSEGFLSVELNLNKSEDIFRPAIVCA